MFNFITKWWKGLKARKKRRETRDLIEEIVKKYNDHGLFYRAVKECVPFKHLYKRSLKGFTHDYTNIKMMVYPFLFEWSVNKKGFQGVDIMVATDRVDLDEVDLKYTFKFSDEIDFWQEPHLSIVHEFVTELYEKATAALEDQKELKQKQKDRKLLEAEENLADKISKSAIEIRSKIPMPCPKCGKSMLLDKNHGEIIQCRSCKNDLVLVSYEQASQLEAMDLQ